MRTNSIPTFAVVGEPNEGKTTLIATLAEVDWAKIDRRAGTTKKRTPYTAKLNGDPVLEFIDTPGFENTPQLLEWFDENKAQPGDLAGKFIAQHSKDPRFAPECEILAAMQDVAVIYVVDAGRQVRPEDFDQMEILRLCYPNRIIAVLNNKTRDERFIEEWRTHLGRNFRWQEFNAHEVRFEDRMALLKAIAGVMPSWQKDVERTIALYQSAWNERLTQSRDFLIELLESTINEQISVPVKTEALVAKAQGVAKEKFQERIRKFENDFRKQVRKLFRHNKADWRFADNNILDDDLFSERVWTLLGLTRNQLVWTGAALGAVIGSGIDLMVGGTSFLMGTLIGGVIGAAGAWMVADTSVDIKVPRFGLLRHLTFPGQSLVKSKQQVEARLEIKSNLIWILIDRAIGYIACAATWAHGKQMEKARLIKVEDSRLVLTKTWSNEDRAPIILWLGLLFAGSDSTEKLRNAQIASETFLLKQIQGIVHRDYSGIDGQPVEPSEIECPHCSEKVIIDGDGEYTCPWCKEDVTVEDGEPVEPYEIECPHCGEEVVIEGNGEFSCPECGEDFVVG